MNITLLTDNPDSWIIPYVEELKSELSEDHEVFHVYKISDITGGDILFLLSCESIVPSEYLALHKNNIVVHPSKLPKGRGWSPLAWQILEGKNKIPVSLFEAVERVDAGDVYLVDWIILEGHELNDEIKHLQGMITTRMIKEYLKTYPSAAGTPQSGDDSYYPRRSAMDSELSVEKSVGEQFDLLRVVDNERYPAFFILNGKKYTLKIHKEK